MGGPLRARSAASGSSGRVDVQVRQVHVDGGTFGPVQSKREDRRADYEDGGHRVNEEARHGRLLVDLQVNLVWAQHGRPAAEAYRASIENDLLPDREKAATKASLKAKAEAVKPKAEKEYTAPKASSGSPFPGRPGLSYPSSWQSMNKAKRAAWKKAQGL